MTVDDNLAYINDVFEEYVRIGKLTPETIAGGIVLEVGPGDNLGVAMKFLADGARKVVSLDRFRAQRSCEREAKIYEALIAELSDEQRARLEGVYHVVDGECTFDTSRLDHRIGTPIEHFQGGSAHDIVVSRSVLEHVADVELAMVAMARALAPGGVMIHRVDLRAHGLFVEHNELFFLSIPAWGWRAMSSNSGLMNRKRVGAYRSLIDRCSLELEEWVINHRFSSEQLAAVKPRLAVEFRGLPDEDLLISGFSFAARQSSRGRTAPTSFSSAGV